MRAEHILPSVLLLCVACGASVEPVLGARAPTPDTAPASGVESPTEGAPPTAAPEGTAPLPLGAPGLDETREREELAPGVAHVHIRRGAPSEGSDGAGTTDSGPWSIHVLEIDPRAFAGRVRVALAGGHVEGRTPLTEIARTHGALAGVNAGYFVMEPSDGTPGDPAGICMLDGELVSENVTGRTSLVLLPDGTARISALRTTLSVSAPGGDTRELDGLNRAPGLVRNCGGTGGDEPAETPMHDVSCTDASELVLFRPIFGEATPRGTGREVVLDAEGAVTEVRARRGGAIPEGGSVLAGTGDAAQWLGRHLRRGTRAEIAIEVVDETLQPLPDGASAVNGGPRLMRAGAIDVPSRVEGFDFDADPEHFRRFGLRRHPRTFAGLTRDGRLLLVAVDGRQPELSVGLTFEETAQLARALGAFHAVNLDGGGSTAMFVRDALVTRPSDESGERPIGDALLLVPTR